MSGPIDFFPSTPVFQAANIQEDRVRRASFVCSVLVTLLLVSLLTACTTSSTASPPPVRQSSSPTAGTTATPRVEATATATPTQAATATATPTQSTCQTSQLTLAYDRSSGLVGNRADQFTLQNSSTPPCTLFGYPQVQLLLADRQSTPTHATQATSGYLFQATLQVVAVPAGAKAYFIIEWVAGLCVNWTATAGQFVQVSLPGATGILTTSVHADLDGGIDACGNIVVSPFSAMSALYGTS